jgi:hypothetical protein
MAHLPCAAEIAGVVRRVMGTRRKREDWERRLFWAAIIAAPILITLLKIYS